MSALSDHIIAAIDAGEDIDIDWQSIESDEDADYIKALLRIHKISNNIREKQQVKLSQFKEGDRWAHLIIKESIGSGGFGEVYRAHDTVLETDVAVKFLNSENKHIKAEDFLQEARLMATVRNPHVLAIHGAAIDQNTAGYWTDFLDGDVLFKRLNSGRIEKNQQQTIINDLIDAVKATHKKGVVHGDIKSLNVMIQKDRGAILLDFGSGRFSIDSDPEIDSIQASPIAMAPEQFNGECGTTASDVFALGLLFTEILSGQHPLVNQSLNEIKNSIKNMPEQLKGMSLTREWCKLLSTMLDPNPASRPDISDVSNAFNNIQTKPLKRAKRLALTASIMLLVGISASSLYSYYSIKQANQQTEEMNELLYNNFLTIERYPEGKAVTLVQVMEKVGGKILNNPDMSQENKEKLLVRMSGTYLTLSDHVRVIDLGNQILDLPFLDTLSRMKVLRYVGLAHAHMREYALAENKLLAILDMKASNEKEYDAQLKAINPLVFAYLNTEQFNKVPDLLATMDALAPHATNRPIMTAAMAHTKAMYYSDTNQKEKAHDAYTLAAENYILKYHKDHYSVLDAYAMAATAYATSNDPDLRQQGIDRLEKLLPQMDAVMGSDHNNYLIAQINLSIGYTLNHQADLALALLHQIQATVYTKLGRTNLLSLMLYDLNLAQALAAAEQQDAAENLFLSVIKHLKSVHPTDPASQSRAALFLMDFYTTSQQYDAARNLAIEYSNYINRHISDSPRLALEVEAMLSRIEFLTDTIQNRSQMDAVYQKHVSILGKTDHQTLALKKTIDHIQRD